MATICYPRMLEASAQHGSPCSPMMRHERRLVRRGAWNHSSAMLSRNTFKRALTPRQAWQGFSLPNGRVQDPDHHQAPPRPLHGRDPVDSNGWKWHEPVLDAKLSSADRAILALIRVAGNTTDRTEADRTVASLGLTLVTNSELCVAPLLPPFGSTLEDDGEEGDGMALPPPPDQQTGPASQAPKRNSSGRSSTALKSAAARKTSRSGATQPAGDAGDGVPLFSLASLGLRQPPNSTTNGNGLTASIPGTEDCTGLECVIRVVSEGAGVDSDDDQHHGSNMGVTSPELRTFSAGMRARSSSSSAAVTRGTGQTGKDGGSAQGGLMGAAAAALTQVARAVNTSAASMQAPVGRAAAGAATAAAAAAQAAVARATMATTQLLPNYGDPASTWVVADDPRGGVRYIVVSAAADLQRRTVRDLTTDLVTFETHCLGAKVNKRLYGEATALYSRFMPLVMDFLETTPGGHICFGGQGVGGSLAVLLQLMACHRGLRFTHLLPAVAVDAPAVLGQVPRSQRRAGGPAAAVREHQHLYQQERLDDVLEDLLSRSVLEEMGLPQDAVRNLLLAQPPPPQPAQPLSQPQPQSNGGQKQRQPQQQQEEGPLLVMAEGAGGGRGARNSDGGSGGAVQAADAARAQVFRLVGKVIRLDTVASASNKVAAVTGAARKAAVLAAGAGQRHVVETDGGSGAVVPAPVARAPAADGRTGMSGVPRLDVALVGSIASAAATAAASAAVERLRMVGGSGVAKRVTSSATLGKATGAAVTTAVMAPVVERKAAAAGVGGFMGTGAMAVAAVFGVKGFVDRGVVIAEQSVGEGEEENGDASVWGI